MPEKDTTIAREILVVDDIPANLRLLSSLLTSHGYLVRPASSGRLALRSVKAKPPDLILLDVKMPDLDGYQVCRELKADERSKKIPVIFISALGEPAEKVEGFRAGGVDYITKPFETEEVLARVRTHLRLHELTEYLEQQVNQRTSELSEANQNLRQEIEQRVNTESLLRKINRAYRALSECNKALIRAMDEQELLDNVCRIIVEDCGYHLVWIGYKEHDEAKSVRPIAQAGYEQGYLNTVNITWADTERGRGPTGTAIRSGKPVVNRDILRDEEYDPWRIEATKRSYASSAAFPLLTTDDEVIGALNVYATLPDAFALEEINLLMELAGELAYGIRSLRTRKEHANAEAALIESEELHRITMENILDPVFITDHVGRFTFISSNIHPNFGYTKDELFSLGSITKLIGNDLFNLEELEKKGELRNLEKTIKDEYDRERVFLIAVKRVAIKSGTILYTFHDITDRKHAEQKITESLREKEVLLREIHHRVKNNMQIISSLLKLQSSSVKDTRYYDLLNESQYRIQAMSLVHERLYQSKDLAYIDFNNYLNDLVRSLFKFHGIDTNKIRYSLTVENIFLDLENAVHCGLLINELVTNSLKYAFPNEMKGHIQITFRTRDDNEYELEVSDDGVGLPDNIDLRNSASLGLKLVNLLAEKQLEGKVELDRTSGTQYLISFHKHNYK